MDKFRVALSGDFLKPSGEPAFEDFDLSPLRDDPAIEMAFVEPVDGVMPAAGLEGFDALILLVAKFGEASVPADGRLSLVARFGVGYDTVDLDVCTRNGIACCITPDGVRRPVATSILTLPPQPPRSHNLMAKGPQSPNDRGPSRLQTKRSSHMEPTSLMGDPWLRSHTENHRRRVTHPTSPAPVGLMVPQIAPRSLCRSTPLPRAARAISSFSIGTFRALGLPSR